MSVSRDFIDYYSPEAIPNPLDATRTPPGGAPMAGIVARITLAFGFRGRHNLGQTAISFRQAGCFFLTLGEKVLERLVQPDGVVHLRAGPDPVGPEPDELFHIRIGRHDLPGPVQGWQIGLVGGPRHGPRHRFEHVDGRIAPALGDLALHYDMPVEN